MKEKIRITRLEKETIPLLIKALTKGGVNRSEDYFNRCFEENISGKRVTFLARLDKEFAGYAM